VAKILVAAADPEQRRALAGAYRVTGNSVVEAADAGACLEILEKAPPEALVLDPRLPGLESSQLLRHVRRNPALAGMRVSLLARGMDAKLWEFLGRQFFDVVVEGDEADAAAPLAAGGAAPRGKKGPKTKAAKTTQVAAPAARRVLVVEDEPTYALLLGTEFKSQGWETVRVDSGEAALAALAKEPVDAVLSDINLPGLMGNDLAFRIREAHPRVKVILMTGMPKDRYPKVPKDVPVLPKPISVKELMAAMRFLRQG
jgi:DNA-binding response OmpR family regulator